MLILNASDVQYCYVSNPKVDRTKIFPGINYRGNLFVKVSDYGQNQLIDAISQAQSRQLLTQKNSLVSIILKEPNGVSLWVHNDQIKLVTTQNSLQKSSSSAPSDRQKVEREYPEGKQNVKPGDCIYSSPTGETYEVLEHDSLFVKTRNLKTGYVRSFSLVEIAYQGLVLPNCQIS